MDIDVLISALEGYQCAVRDLEVFTELAEDAPDHFRAESASRRDRKRAELTLALNRYIDSRIRHVLSGTE